MSDLAQKLIAENKRTRERFLDLGNCGLTQIPAEIAEFHWIESLSLASVWRKWNGRGWEEKRSRNGGEANLLSQLAHLSRLLGLRSLVLDGTDVSDLTLLANHPSLRSLSVARTHITNLDPLASLASLQSLDASRTLVSSLVPLARLTALRKLDISNTRVSNLAPVAKLDALQWLFVSNTIVSRLAPLTNLAALKSLDARGTYVSDLTPLANLAVLESLDVRGTYVNDLGPLTNLASLKTLRLSDTPVSDLAPLANLLSLESLRISNTQARELAPVAKLVYLRLLTCHNTPVSDLTPLADITSLQVLDVSRTAVSDLTPLASLGSLQLLNLSRTQVKSLAPLRELVRKGLPVKASSKAVESNGIYLEDCPLIDPPQEIAAQGNEAILNYFAERARGLVDHLYEAKMLVLGEGGAGKTSLIRRLYQPYRRLPQEKESTRGIKILRHQFKLRKGRIFRLNVWDFGGQQIYHATHQFFLTHRSLYVLLDDTRKDSKSVSDEGFRYWLELIEVFGGHSPTLIFQNEKDNRTKAIDFRGLTQRYDNVKELHGGNLEHADAADKLRDAIEYFAANLSHIGEELPASWIEVRADIERLAASRPYMPLEEYFTIYGKHLEIDEAKALMLSRYLHDLGVFLHFQDDPLLKRTVILQNEWATTAVFRILDDEVVKKKLGRFDQKDCERLWNGTRYDHMHLELLALMQNFELCYALRDSDPPSWLVPQLLAPTKPEELANRTWPGDLILRYKYDFLPKGMISRLTVRQHRFVRNPGMAWVTGVLFEQNNTSVLVQVLPSGDEIDLRARGPESKALLSVISSDLDALNDSFKGLREKVDKRIPCNCKACSTASSPSFFGHRDLVRRKEHGRIQVECPLSFENVDVLQLLDGAKAEPPPAWAKDGTNAEKVRVLRILLASSSELREDRDAFHLFIGQLNDELQKEGIYLQMVRWEHSLNAMSETRLQDEYNDEVRNCDLFVSLFFTRAGSFTREEFHIAWKQFKATGRPLIYTYIKNAAVNTADWRHEDFTSLHEFKNELMAAGHFPTEYTSCDELKLHFRNQLQRIREKLSSLRRGSHHIHRPQDARGS